MLNDGYLESEWTKLATDSGYKFLLILKDLEDKEIFPMYFYSMVELTKYQNNIISESKLKIIKEIKI